MNKKESFFKSSAFQTIIASFICIFLGLLVGFVVLLMIKPSGAWQAITDIVKNFLRYPNAKVTMKYFGNTLVKTAPLLLCSLSVLFCYKVGLFNIGAAGQYALGACFGLYCALNLKLPWFVCLLAGIVAGCILGFASGVLKAYCNVNEVISGIMLNWIALYFSNMVLTNVKEEASPYTKNISSVNKSALLPSGGLSAIFSKNQYVSIAIPLAVVIAIIIWFILAKTKFGYELMATGFNKNAAKYCGIAEKRNIIISLVIGGALAGLGSGLFYLTGYEQWQCTQSSIPAMGFNGIAAAFLGGLHPIGTIFSSFFIQHISEGGAYVDKSSYCSQVSDLICAIIIYLCGFVLFMKTFMSKRIDLAEKKKAQASKKEKGGSVA